MMAINFICILPLEYIHFYFYLSKLSFKNYFALYSKPLYKEKWLGHPKHAFSLSICTLCILAITRIYTHLPTKPFKISSRCNTLFKKAFDLRPFSSVVLLILCSFEFFVYEIVINLFTIKRNNELACNFTEYD